MVIVAPERLTVLIVDDSEADFMSTRDLLARADETAFVARWAPSYEAGLAAIVADRPDVCLVDYDLDGHGGEDFVRDAQRQGALAAMVLLAGYESLVHVAAVHNSGVDDSLLKWKLTPTLLERSVHHAIEIHRMRAQVQGLHRRFHDLADSAGVIYFE
ncbi:MAG: response regulator, partial [bacterium]